MYNIFKSPSEEREIEGGWKKEEGTREKWGEEKNRRKEEQGGEGKGE